MSEAPGRVIVIGDVMTDVIVIPEGPLVRGSDRRAQNHPPLEVCQRALLLGPLRDRQNHMRG